jgi:hypothetical protein
MMQPLALEAFRSRTRRVLGKTWVGTTPPCRATASAGAALVVPTPVLPKAIASTGTVLVEYQTGPQVRPKGE